MNTIISSPLFPYIAVYAVIIVIAVILVCYNTLNDFDLATSEDIIADTINDPWCDYIGAKGQNDPPKWFIKKGLRYANYSYHSFWHGVILDRYRICKHRRRQMYFRVNDFYNHPFVDIVLLKQAFMFISLAFIWGYPLFLLLVPFKKPFDWGYGV